MKGSAKKCNSKCTTPQKRKKSSSGVSYSRICWIEDHVKVRELSKWSHFFHVCQRLFWYLKEIEGFSCDRVLSIYRSTQRETPSYLVVNALYKIVIYMVEKCIATRIITTAKNVAIADLGHRRTMIDLVCPFSSLLFFLIYCSYFSSSIFFPSNFSLSIFPPLFYFSFFH